MSSFKRSFNSLQTGKPIQSWTDKWRGRVLRLFQFPSNGKAYPKNPMGPTWQRKSRFQFPSNGKAYPKKCQIKKAVKPKTSSFNSLQTGKPIQREAPWSPKSSTISRFNSLQTGKPIQRKQPSHHLLLQNYLVSIPFKRESLSKGENLFRQTVGRSVSIPFKRESLSKGQSESCNKRWKNWVSIPFKRESLSKEIGWVDLSQRFKMSFNSLQTGKPIQSSPYHQRETGTKSLFQFPSNGKAYPKKVIGTNIVITPIVSIPFKRESLSKV